MKKNLLKMLLATGLLGVQLSAVAEDIDLFVGRTPGAGEVPNVLFILDSTANWNTAFTAEIGALRTTFANMAVNADGSAKFNVGLMMFAESPVKGAYIRAAIRPMTGAASTNNRQKYADLINSFDQIQDKGANALYAYSMAEAYRYFKGMTEYVGADERKRDYLNNPTGTAQSIAVHALTGNALSNSTDKIYDQPASVAGCAKNFIIYISNGKVDNSDKEGTSPQCPTNLKACTAQQLLALEGGETTRILISPAGEANNMSDEWAKFMKKSSLGVTTYTIDVGTPDADHTALLKSMADESEGKYFEASAASTDEIAKAIGAALTEIQAVNSVFAAVSLPVSVNTQGSYRNQVFIGMFRPDENALPRWQGNLKQYKLDLVSNVLKLVDADGTPAINSGTGFITGCARSFWTPSTVDTYWNFPGFSPENNCLTVADSAVSNYPDGNIVEKGAQAYVLRSSTTRTVKTCSATFASCTALTDFNGTNVSPEMLGLAAASTAERDAMVNWAKGRDVLDENGNEITTDEMRPSAHGDVVHSRPVAINFGTEGVPQVVVFYGGNDGMLRAVNGNRSAAIGSVAAGAELWSFMPPEFYGSIKRLYDNSTQINFPGNVNGTPLPKPYGIDGPIVGYQPDSSNAWLYATMRRGGRALYAFDISNPASPSLKWKRGCPNNFTSPGVVDDTGCLNDITVGDWSAIGQTWSAPRVLKAGGYVTTGPSPTKKPLLIMGGGYDTCQDSDPNTSCSATSKGNKIYLLDADNGNLQQTFSTESSVIGELTVVPDMDGLATYIYAADLGGNVYRISGATANSPIGNTAPGSWTITRIAALGGSGVNNRKFMFTPDVVDNTNGIYSIILGSGDREKPLLSYTAAASVNNYFFMLQDKPAETTWLSSESVRCSGNYLCLDSLSAIAADGGNPTDLDTHKGWRLGLKPNEQIVTSAITVFDTVTFSTHRPFGSLPPEPEQAASPTCGPDLGTAKVYNVNYANAAANSGMSRSQLIHGGGLPPSPVAGMVKLDNGEVVPFIIGAKGDSPLEGGTPPAPATAIRPKSRAYWYIQK